jgi:hypothetical protein
MDYFFATNVFGAKIAGPFETYDEAAKVGQAAPKEMKPVAVSKVTFCNSSGDPCSECLRVCEGQIEAAVQSIEALKKTAPQVLHQ